VGNFDERRQGRRSSTLGSFWPGLRPPPRLEIQSRMRSCASVSSSLYSASRFGFSSRTAGSGSEIAARYQAMLTHITLLPGITREKARPHYKAGVTSVHDLAALDIRTATAIDDGRDVRGVEGMCQTTAAYVGTGVSDLRGAIDQARVQRSGKVHRARGIEFVDLPRAAIEIDIDSRTASACRCSEPGPPAGARRPTVRSASGSR